MTTYTIQYFNTAGVLQETTTQAFNARQAIDDVLANQGNILRVTRAVPQR